MLFLNLKGVILLKNDYFNTFEKKDVDIQEDIELDFQHSSLFAVVETWFDVDKKFGINVNNDDNVWVNLFADYQPFSGELRIFYDIDADKKAYEREYIPTDENCLYSKSNKLVSSRLK